MRLGEPSEDKSDPDEEDTQSEGRKDGNPGVPLCSTGKHNPRGRLVATHQLRVLEYRGTLRTGDYTLPEEQRRQGSENSTTALCHTSSLALNVKNLGNSFCKRNPYKKQ